MPAGAVVMNASLTVGSNAAITAGGGQRIQPLALVHHTRYRRPDTALPMRCNSPGSITDDGAAITAVAGMMYSVTDAPACLEMRTSRTHVRWECCFHGQNCVEDNRVTSREMHPGKSSWRAVLAERSQTTGEGVQQGVETEFNCIEFCCTL